MSSLGRSLFVRILMGLVTTLAPIIGFIVVGLTMYSSMVSARTIILNGTDISSAKSQEMRNVNIYIDEKGDVFITAPHYQVNEEDTYTPLSKYIQGINYPKHTAAQDLPGVQAQVGTTKEVPPLPSKPVDPAQTPPQNTIQERAATISSPAPQTPQPLAQPQADSQKKAGTKSASE